MLLYFVRTIFLLSLLGIALSYVTGGISGSNVSEISEGTAIFAYHKEAVILGTVGLGILVIGLDILISRKSLSAISGLFLGLLAGLTIAFVFSLIIDLIVDIAASDLREPVLGTVVRNVNGQVVPQTIVVGYRDKPVVGAVKLLIGVICCYISVSFILQTKDDIRFIIPYVEFEKQVKGGRPILLDTSAIIDGRILDVAKTKIFDNPLVIPRFVLQELQLIADSSDKLKRTRGRRGLDIINKLQSEKGLDISIHEISHKGGRLDVDQKLVSLAEELSGKIITTDYNLNKVARIRGVDVINLNDLANSLKPVVLPGEIMQIKIIKPGEEAGQGVGYLDDGTMVVVEGAKEKIGKIVNVIVTSSLQTSAGKMIFARYEEDYNHGGRNNSRNV